MKQIHITIFGLIFNLICLSLAFYEGEERLAWFCSTMWCLNCFLSEKLIDVYKRRLGED